MIRIGCIILLMLINILALMFINIYVYSFLFCVIINPMILNFIYEYLMDITFTYESDEGYLVKVYFRNTKEKEDFILKHFFGDDNEKH